jgi:DNA invertase Pin-like site-specific DNA recombinase
MAGQVVGYARVSSLDQSTARQDLGDVDRLFEEKVSGKDRNRPALAALLQHVREDDLVRVHSMDRLARSLADLIALVRELTDRGVTVEFIKERLVFGPGTDDPYSQLQMHLLGAFAEFERAIIRSRQAEGIAKAKRAGVYKGRAKALTDDQIAAARERLAAGVAKAAVARDLGVSRTTLYAALSG